MKIKNVHIFGGGTVAHIANHFAVTAPAYGSTAQTLSHIMQYDKRFDNMRVNLELTKMAGGKLETNEDVANRIEELKAEPRTKIIFFNCALVDYNAVQINTYNDVDYDPTDTINEIGKYAGRLNTSDTPTVDVTFKAAKKIIPNIRTGRKDIFLVGFKTTCGASKQEMYEKGLHLCKTGSVNLVLVNDTKTHWNMIVTPEEAAYHETDDREKVLRNLVDMTWHRSHLTFTQSTVVDGKPVDWNDERIPNSIRTVVNYCINGNAYKAFNGSTVGHFAIKISDNEFLTSIRKSNFNDLNKIGMVYVKTDGPDTVLAYGAKPSVGGQSQRIVFRNHENMDCIVHFHSPLRPNHPCAIPIVSQREVECGSHQCGKNTSDNLREFPLFGGLKAVMLDNHGPNIVFNRNIDPQKVIDFIDFNFDLTKKTGGYNLR
jgi:hypothetical protein